MNMNMNNDAQQNEWYNPYQFEIKKKHKESKMRYLNVSILYI